MASSSEQFPGDWPLYPPRDPKDFNSLVSAARTSLRNYQYEEALSYGEAALALPRLRHGQKAAVACLLAEANENLARFSAAIQALAGFERSGDREKLTVDLQIQVLQRLASAYGGTTETPQAIAFGKQALALATDVGEAAALGASHLILGTLYRRVGETRFAHDHFLQAKAQFLHHQDPVRLAQAWNGLGLVSLTEGDWESAQTAFTLGREVLDGDSAPLLQGSLDINLAVLIALQGQWRASVKLLERAIPILERARNPRLIVNARSNLGCCLLRLGDWERAQALLQQSLSEAQSCEATLVAASVLETLGELHCLQGRYQEADEVFRQSLELLETIHVGFNIAQSQLTRGRCRLLSGHPTLAAESFKVSLEVSERLGDPRGLAAAHLWLIEAYLEMGEPSEAQQLFTRVRPRIERMGNVPLLGHLRELSGHFELLHGAWSEAIRHYSQAVSIWEMTGELYRQAVASYRLGTAYLQALHPRQARAAFEAAQTLFAQLAAWPMHKRVTAALAALPAADSTPTEENPGSVDMVSALTRLLEAGASQDLLLYELTRILHRDFGTSPVAIFHQTEDRKITPLVWQGCDESFALHLMPQVARVERGQGTGDVYSLFTAEEGRWLIFLGREKAQLPESLLGLIIKQLETSLDRVRWRPRSSHTQKAEPVAFLAQPLTLPGLIYSNEQMRRIVEQVHSLRTSDITVLITGESGTGKELIARGIHALSNRAASIFVPFNCAAVQRDLLESQLFGHKRGSFTGALTDSPGVIGAAAGGTIFLDEISELTREVQPRLLRFLQFGEIQRLGESLPLKIDVRIIAASNRNLEEMILAGDFRADLYYRLNVIQFHLPALRERREEIPLLAQHFLEQCLVREEKEDITLSAEVLDLLRWYDWPGNIRQLENEIQRLVALTVSGHTIALDHLSPHISRGSAPNLMLDSYTTTQRRSLADRLEEAKHKIVKEAFLRHKGNITKMADELGLSRFGLYKMLSRYQIRRPPESDAE
jgi:DNA-binding NtrC family response regulator/tetratricopeptide (TPR) repeat protein